MLGTKAEAALGVHTYTGEEMRFSGHNRCCHSARSAFSTGPEGMCKRSREVNQCFLFHAIQEKARGEDYRVQYLLRCRLLGRPGPSLHRGLSIVLKAIESTEREKQNARWDRQHSRAAQRLFPIYCRQEE